MISGQWPEVSRYVLYNCLQKCGLTGASNQLTTDQ